MITVLPGMPNLGRTYLRAIATLARPLLAPGAHLPDAALVVERVRIDPRQLARYNALCEFPTDAIPITFPLVFTLPVQLALLTRADSPLRLPGLVHLGVTLEQTTTLARDADYRVTCAIAEQRSTARGLEFAVSVALSQGEDTAWRGTSRILARTTAPSRSGQRRAQPPCEFEDLLVALPVPENIGRRYAQVSGDWNPIHLGRVGARALGFDRAIAHGMWTLARMAGAAGGAAAGDGRRLSGDFLAPLKLPGRIEIRADATRRALCAVEADSGRVIARAQLEDIP